MKLQLSNSQYNNTMLLKKFETSKQHKYKNKIQDNYDKKNMTRPAQAQSFSGSAVSSVGKFANSFIENKTINSLIGIVKGNEAAFNAAYALIVAGMLKPGLVLAQTGFNDKDGQMIATKNFLQAFVGFFLGITIGGGFIKKIWDSMETNFRLLDVEEFKNGSKKIVPGRITDENVRDAARDVLVKENTRFIDKHRHAQFETIGLKGWDKVKQYIHQYRNYKYSPLPDEINNKAASLLDNLKKNHIDIFNKNEQVKEFSARLIKNLKDITDFPADAKYSVPKGFKSHVWDAFESVNKNITNVPTVIAKAKISSLLLPAAVAAIFANKVSNSSKKSNEQTKADTSNNAKNEKTPSFKGGSSYINKALMKSTRAFEKLALSGFGEGFTKVTSKISPTPSRMMSQIESFGITFYWLINTHFSKKIDPDQKLGLNVHTALVTLVSCFASILLDGGTDIIIDKAENAYGKRVLDAAQETIQEWENNSLKHAEFNKMLKLISDINIKDDSVEMKEATEIAQKIAKDIAAKCDKLYNAGGIAKKYAMPKSFIDAQSVKKAASNITAVYGKHLKKFKSLTIFTLVVRFLVPVLTVKQSKKVKKVLIEFSKNRAQKNKEAKAEQ